MSLTFQQLRPEFYQYMINVGGIAPKTAKDYISRLNFLSNSHEIDVNISEQKLREILDIEDALRLSREKYATKKAIGDLSAGLRKFLAFSQFNYAEHIEKQIKTEINAIESKTDLSLTTKENVIQSRVGQGAFRKNLISIWECCSFSGCNMIDILVASHIKPWRMSDNKERMDPFNGFLLLPNFDKLFDKGYITVERNGRIRLSKYIQAENKEQLNLTALTAVQIQEQHKSYLEFHNKTIFMG